MPGIIVTLSRVPGGSGAFEVVKEGEHEVKYWSKLDGEGFPDDDPRDERKLRLLADRIKADANNR